jgi:hypothetical protein
MIRLRNSEFLSRQLCFKFTFGKRLIKSIKRGFIWIRPDGKQKPCSSIRSLVKAIMDYDGHILLSLVAQANRMRVVAA